MNPFRSAVFPTGTRLQSGIPKGRQLLPVNDARGVLMRGVVTATYVLDDPAHPLAGATDAQPTAVYCDVLAFGRAWFFIPKALVAQERSGLHSGHVWKPRAATRTLTGDPVSLNKATNPANLDGDHVLVGFLDGNFNQPVILRELPHPAASVGNEEFGIGQRLRLLQGDGDPDLWRHHGTFFGVEDDGSWVVDTTHANDGSLEDEGREPAPPVDGKGAHRSRLPQDAEWSVELQDVGDPSAPETVFHMLIQKDHLTIDVKDPAAFIQALIDTGATFRFEGKDGDARLTIGDGAVKVAIYEALEDFWNNTVKVKMDAFDNHIHSTGVGPSGPPAPKAALPTLATAIGSTKVTIPDN